MPFEEDGQNLISEYNKIYCIYDSKDYLPKFGYYYLLKEKINEPNIINPILISIKNNNKYLDTDKFSENDVTKFNKNLKKKAKDGIVFNY